MRALYLAQTNALFVVEDPALDHATERHKINLALQPLATAHGLFGALSEHGPFDGVIFEIQRGWIGRDRLLLARRTLSRGLRVWAHWPAEQAIEVIDRERLWSYARLWAFIKGNRGWKLTTAATARAKAGGRRAVHGVYDAARRPVSTVAAEVRRRRGFLASYLEQPRKFVYVARTRGLRAAMALTAQYLSQTEERVPVVSDDAITASRTRIAKIEELAGIAAPVAFQHEAWREGRGARVPGVGMYLRTDYWARIESGGSYGHTCYVAKELAAATERFVCFMAYRYPLLDTYGVHQVVLDPPGPSFSETELAQATEHYVRLLKPAVEALKPSYIYERLCLGNYAGTILSRAFGIPYIVEYNGSEISMRRSFEHAGFAFEEEFIKAEDLAFKQATMISVVSKEVRNSLIARGVPAEKILVNPNGADPSVYRPASPDERSAIRAEIGFRPEDRVVGFTGTFGGWHGVDVLAKALPGVCGAAPTARFLLIGDGAFKHLVDDVVSAHKLQHQVRVVGRVPQAKGARLLSACDIFVSPHNSHMVDSRFFGSPTKLFEYMAMGGGIVASDLEQLGEVLSPALSADDVTASDVMVTDERAVLCEPGDVGQFERSVVALVQRPEIADQLGRNARAALEQHYSWARHVSHLWPFLAGRNTEIGDLRRKERRRPEFATVSGPELAFAGVGGGNVTLPPARTVRTPVIVTGDVYKDEVQKQWDNDPCGSQYVKEAEPHTKEWFLEAERYRYDEYGPWMHEVMEFAKHAGEQVLEIGGGMGTDLAQFAQHGAHVTDVDLSIGHLELAQENFRHRGLQGRFVHQDAERLPFDDNSFDVVYSNGVIHHTPNTQSVVNEIYRVLRPGGKAIIMVYAENSLHYWRNLVGMLGLDEAQLEQYSIGEIMSRSVERSDNAAARPLVKVYTKKRLRGLFAAFEDIQIVQRQMVPAEKPHLLRRVPLETVGKIMGWNLIIKAKKPPAR